MMIGEPKMSLGYVKGKMWVTDDRYQRYVEWDTYKALVTACGKAGISFNCTYSYTARTYTAEITTISKINDRYYITKHNLAYDPHPMLAVVAAIRGFEHGSPLLTVLCMEMDCRIIGEKLLPMHALEKAFDDLTETLQ